MSENKVQAIVILPHIKVQNVNVISSPLLWGFPSVHSILGFVHALERRIKTISAKNNNGVDNFANLLCEGVAIICHSFQANTVAKFGEHSFSLTRNPVTKEGKPPAINQEGKGYMEISLLIKITNDERFFNVSEDDLQKHANTIFNFAKNLRIAGGTIVPNEHGNNYAKYQPKILFTANWNNDENFEKNTRKELYGLLPGFMLFDRQDLLIKHYKKINTNEKPNKNESNEHGSNDSEVNKHESNECINGKTILDALLDLIAVHVNKEKSKMEQGWLVPISIGFRGISKLYNKAEQPVINSRDPQCPFQFVENLYSLGEWIGLHRFNTKGSFFNLSNMFWQYKYERVNDQDFYFCDNKKKV